MWLISRTLERGLVVVATVFATGVEAIGMLVVVVVVVEARVVVGGKTLRPINPPNRPVHSTRSFMACVTCKI